MLELKNVSYSVAEEGQTKEIITGLSLTAEDGQLLVITGPNPRWRASSPA